MVVVVVVVGADGKVVIEILCLSLPYVEKHFSSFVIKSFVPELRSRKCSGFLCYLYMSYEHSMYISHIHVWLCYSRYSLQVRPLCRQPGRPSFSSHHS